VDARQAIKVTGENGNYVVDPASSVTEFESVKSIEGKGYNLRVNGLAEGTYYLVETKAPDGFNKLTDPIKVTITKTGDTEWTVSKGEDVETDKIIDVVNSTGSLLPSTGGAGVIVFAGVAILLVFGVVVSFIRDKRKAC
jgi:LPXTG-motif cell wall-anchored protein